MSIKKTCPPYDAIMLVSYGGPRTMEDVLPFMRNATAGRGIPDERLLQVSEHYRLFNGASPINERNEQLRQALQNSLAGRGWDIPVVIGNRNWTPYFHETLTSLVKNGARRVLCLFTAAYACYSGCRQYREDLAQAWEKVACPDLVLDKVTPYANTEGFVQANIEAIAAALKDISQELANNTQSASIGAYPQDGPHLRPHLLAVTHSIPDAMQAGSAPTKADSTKDSDASDANYEIPDYVRQHQLVGTEICRRLSEQLGWEIALDLAYCSRSGPPQQPWLEPDVNDRLTELAQSGVRGVVVAPIGFINDHMEVVYDLDTEAKETASQLGISYRRAATVGTHPSFVAALTDLILTRSQLDKTEADNCNSGNTQYRTSPALAVDWPDHTFCPPTHCLPAPGAAPDPALFDR